LMGNNRGISALLDHVDAAFDIPNLMLLVCSAHSRHVLVPIVRCPSVLPDSLATGFLADSLARCQSVSTVKIPFLPSYILLSLQPVCQRSPRFKQDSNSGMMYVPCARPPISLIPLTTYIGDASLQPFRAIHVPGYSCAGRVQRIIWMRLAIGPRQSTVARRVIAGSAPSTPLMIICAH
jgi:hypothetical protein